MIDKYLYGSLKNTKDLGQFPFQSVQIMTAGNKLNNIGITHVFSCINICWVPRKLFEHEAIRLSAQTSPEGPDKCLCNETNMYGRYSCIFYLISTKVTLKTVLNI